MKKNNKPEASFSQSAKKYITNLIEETNFIKNSLFLILIHFSFYKSINDLVYQNYLEPYLIKTDNRFLIYVVFIILIAIVYDFQKKVSNTYKYSNTYAFTCFLILIEYSCFRIFYHNRFLFIYHEVAYTDVLFLYFLKPFTLKAYYYLLRKEKKDKTSNSITGIIDEPVVDRDKFIGFKEDQPLFDDFVNRIKEGTNHNSSRCFSLVAPWGTGKTSYLTFIKQDLEKCKNIEILEFNPWLFSKQNTTDVFFDEIQKKLKKRSQNINNLLEHYTDEIIKSKFKITPFRSQKSTKDQYDNLNIQLKKSKIQYFILIDDLDRLQEVELLEVFKLIRNLASFHSFTFVIAYDENYLKNTITSIDDLDFYLEKIINRKYYIPQNTDEKLIHVLRNFLLTILPDYKSEIEELITDDDKHLKGIFKSIREIKRFCTDTVDDFIRTKDNVDFKDYFILKILQFKFKKYYDFLLFDSPDLFGKTHNDRYVASKYIEKNKNIEPEKLPDELKHYKKEEIAKILTLTDKLFPEMTLPVHGYKEFSITYKLNFYRYFDSYIRDFDLTKTEYENIFKLNKNDVFSIIENWSDNQKIKQARLYFDNKSYNITEQKNIVLHLNIVLKIDEQIYINNSGNYYCLFEKMLNYNYIDEDGAIKLLEINFYEFNDHFSLAVLQKIRHRFGKPMNDWINKIQIDIFQKLISKGENPIYLFELLGIRDFIKSDITTLYEKEVQSAIIQTFINFQEDFIKHLFNKEKTENNSIKIIGVSKVFTDLFDSKENIKNYILKNFDCHNPEVKNALKYL
ncbi:KAP family P-loop NTPase fold protein [Ochrovirga pacifica]|uniref:KAP family P-loop NTPase fold protein n=1 Tax=Ochrovirga pacifica TaxID=1042376 RepID=UPI0002559B03|nr:P-loop NTPase fold protein [Ochrovirga pacifica]